jgi:hypothetical protein
MVSMFGHKADAKKYLTERIKCSCGLPHYEATFKVDDSKMDVVREVAYVEKLLAI